ncbi:MAG: hypothetical protein WCV90_02900 [Candidatus Woesearchaeota archaeon]|jgi:CheY-like chemotaxis protein
MNKKTAVVFNHDPSCQYLFQPVERVRSAPELVIENLLTVREARTLGYMESAVEEGIINKRMGRRQYIERELGYWGRSMSADEMQRAMDSPEDDAELANLRQWREEFEAKLKGDRDPSFVGKRFCNYFDTTLLSDKNVLGAIDYLRENKADCIFLDAMLETGLEEDKEGLGLNFYSGGVTLYQRIRRELEGGSTVPIVVLTHNRDADIYNFFKESGDEHVHMGFLPDMFSNPNEWKRWNKVMDFLSKEMPDYEMLRLAKRFYVPDNKGSGRRALVGI